ncbi:MAG: Hsp20/alpha crystallin family protein, partial [Candidatus Natronoplasma sp.]
SIFEDLDRTLNRFLGRPREGRRFSTSMPALRSPVTDLSDLGDKYRVEAEIPGIDKDDIEIELRDDSLVIEAEKEEETEEEGEDYLRRERGFKSFYRKLPLPEEVNPEEVAASLENGILSIDMPKKEPEKKKGKKIEIE